MAKAKPAPKVEVEEVSPAEPSLSSIPLPGEAESPASPAILPPVVESLLPPIPPENELHRFIESEPAMKDAYAAAAEIKRLRAENAELKAIASLTSGITSASTSASKKARKMRAAEVSFAGTHVKPVVVEFPADAENPTTAAIAAAKAMLGVWSFGVGPTVKFLD